MLLYSQVHALLAHVMMLLWPKSCFPLRKGRFYGEHTTQRSVEVLVRFNARKDVSIVESVTTEPTEQIVKVILYFLL